MGFELDKVVVDFFRLADTWDLKLFAVHFLPSATVQREQRWREPVVQRIVVRCPVWKTNGFADVALAFCLGESKSRYGFVMVSHCRSSFPCRKDNHRPP